MKKTVLTFGLISGGILSAMMLITAPFIDSIGVDRGEIIGYTTMILASLLIFFGIRQYRDTVGGGEVSFRRALAVGSLIVLISSLCYTATWEAMFFGLRPDYAARMQEAQVARVKSSGASPEQTAKQLADLKRFSEMYRNPVINAAITMLEPLPVGLVIAFVSAGILSRRRRTAAPQFA